MKYFVFPQLGITSKTRLGGIAKIAELENQLDPFAVDRLEPIQMGIDC